MSTHDAQQERPEHPETPQHTTAHDAERAPSGPRDSTLTPRFAGPASFALLPLLDAVGTADIAVVGVPFDAGGSYRPGARFGPAHVRESSRLLRPYNPAQDIAPFAVQQVADAGDIVANPFDLDEAMDQVYQGGRADDPCGQTRGDRRRPHDRVSAAARSGG